MNQATDHLCVLVFLAAMAGSTLFIDFRRNLKKWSFRIKDCKDDPKPPRAIQVKEKFGGLRFYMSHMTDEMAEAINEAEEKATKTCEVCGRSGKLRQDRRWIRTLCEEHNQNT